MIVLSKLVDVLLFNLHSTSIAVQYFQSFDK